LILLGLVEDQLEQRLLRGLGLRQHRYLVYLEQQYCE